MSRRVDGPAERLSFTKAERRCRCRNGRDISVEYVLFPDEGHGWRKTPNRIRSTVALVNWFDTHLKKEQSTGTLRLASSPQRIERCGLLRATAEILQEMYAAHFECAPFGC